MFILTAAPVPPEFPSLPVTPGTPYRKRLFNLNIISTHTCTVCIKQVEVHVGCLTLSPFLPGPPAAPVSPGCPGGPELPGRPSAPLDPFCPYSNT